MTRSSEYDTELLERAKRVRMLALDVDGVLTDGRLYFDNDGNELKSFSTRDGLGMRLIQKYGVELALITGRTSGIVEARARQLGIRHVYQGRNDKLNALRELVEATGIEPAEICFAGDDLLDLPVLQKVGLSVTVADAEAPVKSRVDWITEADGGRGAVREICNLIIRAKGLEDRILQEMQVE